MCCRIVLFFVQIETEWDCKGKINDIGHSASEARIAFGEAVRSKPKFQIWRSADALHADARAGHRGEPIGSLKGYTKASCFTEGASKSGEGDLFSGPNACFEGPCINLLVDNTVLVVHWRQFWRRMTQQAVNLPECCSNSASARHEQRS